MEYPFQSRQLGKCMDEITTFLFLSPQTVEFFVIMAGIQGLRNYAETTHARDCMPVERARVVARYLTCASCLSTIVIICCSSFLSLAPCFFLAFSYAATSAPFAFFKSATYSAVC